MINIVCPKCREVLSVPGSLAGHTEACPHCGNVCVVQQPPVRPPQPVAAAPAPSRRPGPRFPIIIRPTTRALYAKYVWRAILWHIGFLIALMFSISARATSTYFLIWGTFGGLLLLSAIRLWFDYRRIKHTIYRVFSNKIETTSYLFRFMGTYNNVVNLAQLRKIQANVNTLLDLWFFKCGMVTLTVSGDVADFRIENVYRPSRVRMQIEEVAFGRDSVVRSKAPVAEVDGAD